MGVYLDFLFQYGGGEYLLVMIDEFGCVFREWFVGDGVGIGGGWVYGVFEQESVILVKVFCFVWESVGSYFFVVYQVFLDDYQVMLDRVDFE